MLTLNAFDDAILTQYVRLVLKAHETGRWGTGVATAELACVIRVAARQDPALMLRIRDAIDLMDGRTPRPLLVH
jgi:hypothetical protein